MSRIRPLERADVQAVARLHAEAQPDHAPDAVDRLASFFERTLVDSPWADPEIPSLVATDGDAIVGFLGSYVRHMELEDRRLRLACSAHLLTARAVRNQALGALLLRAYLGGVQDMTITDGATREVQLMWERFGGSTAHLQGLVWVEAIRPASLGLHWLAQRAGLRALETALTPLAAALDLPARPALRARGAEPFEVQPADPTAFAAAVGELARAFALRPVYDAAYLDWLFGQLRRLAADAPVFPDRVTRGTLDVGVVTVAGRTTGAYVCQVRRRGACRVLAAVCAEADAPTLLAAIRSRAEAGRAAAVFGRVEPHLLPAVWQRRTFLRYGGGRMLVHSADKELERVPVLGDAVLTRLDGEWW
jgi:hypothetical protein